MRIFINNEDLRVNIGNTVKYDAEDKLQTVLAEAFKGNDKRNQELPKTEKTNHTMPIILATAYLIAALGTAGLLVAVTHCLILLR